MLDIRTNGDCYYLNDSGHATILGTLDEPRKSGLSRLKQPTPSFWAYWNFNNDTMRGLGFRVKKFAGKWQVNLSAQGRRGAINAGRTV